MWVIVATMVAVGLTGCSTPTREVDADDTELPPSAPAKLQSPGDIACPPMPLEVVIEYALAKESTGGVLVTAQSNLPDRTELMASLYADGGAFFAQDTSPLLGGVAEFGPFSDKGVPLKGTYELSITAPIARNQPDEVQECIGAAGEHLRGPLVSVEEITGDNVASVDVIVSIEYAIHALGGGSLMPELISTRIRAAFRDCASGIVLRDIERLWEGEDFRHGFYDENGGQRVSLWRAYEAAVDWANADHARRVMRVYEVVLSDFSSEETRERLKVTLSRDGWRYDEDHRIVPTVRVAAPLSGLTALRSADGIEEAFNRVSLLIGADPGGVVAASKELIEATAKTALDELNIEYTDREDFSALIPRTQRALGLAAGVVDGELDNASSVRRILGGLASIAQGIDELRNSEGGGHGRARSTRLRTRHARLAFNGARAWCEIVLDTLIDPDAPWRSGARSE